MEAVAKISGAPRSLRRPFQLMLRPPGGRAHSPLVPQKVPKKALTRTRVLQLLLAMRADAEPGSLLGKQKKSAADELTCHRAAQRDHRE